MNNGELIIIGVHCNYLSFAKGNKLGAMRHLRDVFDKAKELQGKKDSLKELKPEATEDELSEAVKEFENEEYTQGLPVIPAEWFDNVSNESIIATTDKGEKFEIIPFESLNFLIKKGVMK